MNEKSINPPESAVDDLRLRKAISRSYIRSLSPNEKVLKLAQLQEQFYQFLSIREQNGGKAIPEGWRKWYRARKSYSDSIRKP